MTARIESGSFVQVAPAPATKSARRVHWPADDDLKVVHLVKRDPKVTTLLLERPWALQKAFQHRTRSRKPVHFDVVSI